MILKTKNYDQFIFRNDNRSVITPAHVNNIADSIRIRNLLNHKPILVNEKMEIMDGQHRLLAAKRLGVDIYYEIRKNATMEDIICLNISKSWSREDYLNYFVKNGYPEYIKLNDFIRSKQVSIKVAIDCVVGKYKKNSHGFKTGKFVFSNDFSDDAYETVLLTIDKVNLLKPGCRLSMTTKFWRPMLKLVSHPEFNRDQWMKNLVKLIDRMETKTNETAYAKLFSEIYNYRMVNKIDLSFD